MKKRLGFVSNSSSSSFLIYGVYLESDLITLLEEKYTDAYLKKYNIEVDVASDATEDDIAEAKSEAINEEYYEFLDYVAGEIGIDYHSGGYDESYYLGESWDQVKDDQTGLEFKTNVQDRIKSVLPDAEFGTHEEAWYG